MAFGKISVVSRRTKPIKPLREEKVPEVKKTPVVYSRGTSVMEILLLAPTCEEAEDFLCGCYFNLCQAVGGSSMSVYTKEFATITRLTETKQLMEETILKPVGRELVRKTSEDETPLAQCTITLGQAGNHALAMDLHFTWSTPSAAAGHQADVVFALMNCAESKTAQDHMAVARQAAAGRPIIWILSGFEKKSLFWAADTISSPKAELRSQLQEMLELTCGTGEYATYVQLYGGLEFVGRTDTYALLRSDRRCREYMPVGCHVPVFVAMDTLRRFRANQEGAAAADVAFEKVWMLMQAHKDTLKGWYDGQAEKGAIGK